jgi:hypothetical protein
MTLRANRRIEVSSDVTGEMVQCIDGERNETGAILILALAYLVVVSVIVLSLTSWASNDLNNTGKFTSANSLQLAATSATNVAIQSIRYAPLLSAGQTVNAAPPTYCWGSSAPSQILIDSGGTGNPLAIDVWCSTQWDPLNAAGATRVVTFSTCLDTLPDVPTAGQINAAAQACAANPLLRAVVTFDDYPSAGSAPIQGVCFVFCGQGMTLTNWDWSPGTG